MNKTIDGVTVTVVRIDAFSCALHLGPTAVKCGGGTFSAADAAVVLGLASEMDSVGFAFIAGVARRLSRREKLTRDGIFAAREAEIHEVDDAVPARLRRYAA